MRITTTEKNNFINLSQQYFGSEISLYLFGSRVDDDKKGGDIDLFIESQEQIGLETRLKFLGAVERNITIRKVDLLVKTPFVTDKVIFTTAKKTGIKLC